MKDNYAIDVSNKKIRLFFIPGNQCITCIKNNEINQYLLDSNYLIITNAPRLKEIYGGKAVFDEKSKLMKIKQNEYSNTIWDLENNQVMEIKQGIVLVDTNLLKGN